MLPRTLQKDCGHSLNGNSRIAIAAKTLLAFIHLHPTTRTLKRTLTRRKQTEVDFEVESSTEEIPKNRYFSEPPIIDVASTFRFRIFCDLEYKDERRGFSFEICGTIIPCDSHYIRQMAVRQKSKSLAANFSSESYTAVLPFCLQEFMCPSRI
ncbi:uncharacterized protein LOC107273489 [Cephus cinctus]|uniref:Uncharacterized protein LOC107271790 n=1 Tax=Cephus cinctus TaxID=211228 RepID=A0AAJ7C7B2_CEPCN|nr:uncharacterized protein LOC107271790 [Cephus cinctus]XP_015607233.1 uncharacterized protein LOC107273489 [Cephus cinctus]